MSLACGIVGLPNVGKSTLFNALTKAGARVENYPFCTIDPNSGVVEVPDERLQKINEFMPTEKIIPAILEFVDIAGLVRGASQGEGLGNQFLSHIREVNVIVHVVRCFEDGDIIHVDGNIDALRDLETIETELLLSDLERIAKRRHNLGKKIRANDKVAKKEDDLLEKIESAISNGKTVQELGLSEDDMELTKEVRLITSKPVIFVCNVSEADVVKGNKQVDAVRAHAEKRGSEVLILSAAIEAEISELDDEAEKLEFLESMGLDCSGLQRLAQKGFQLLGLQTYFTAGPKEIRAWTIEKGCSAPKAAGVIHSDFERGFIRAETYGLSDLEKYKTEKAIREAGKLRVEGKEYIVQDGDIMHFLFNV